MVLTITSDPPFFAAVAAKVRHSGGRVIVIVSRSTDERASTAQELAKYGLEYDDLIFLPPIEQAVEACPHKEELGYYRSYLWHKVHIAEQAGATHFVGQEPLVIELFRRFLPNVTVRYPRDLYPRAASVPIDKPSSPREYRFLQPPTPEYQLYKSRIAVQQDAAPDIPWEPLRAYSTLLRGDIETLYRVVTKLNGAVYVDGTVVLPTRVDLDHLNNLLEREGDGTCIASWLETWAGPPGR